MKRTLLGLLACLSIAAQAAEKTQVLQKHQLLQTFDSVFSTSDLRIDNYGSKKKSEWYRQQSRWVLPSGQTVRFDFPRKVLVLSTPVGLRYWHYYINELDLDRVQVKAAPGGMRVLLDFEQQGNEIKGKCTRRKIDGPDNCDYRGKRDINLENVRLELFLRPAPVAGRLGYAPIRPQDIGLQANFRMPKGLCRLLAATSFLTGDLYTGALGAQVISQVCDKLSKELADWMRDSLRDSLRQVLNRDPVRRAIAQAVSGQLGLGKDGWRVTGITDQGGQYRVQLSKGGGKTPGQQPPPRKPAKPAPKPRSPIKIVQFEADPKVQYGRCPTVVKFKGKIRRMSPGTVKYRFVNHKGVSSGTYRMQFKAPGEQPTVPWQVGVKGRSGMQLAGSANAGRKAGFEAEGWVMLVVEGPLGEQKKKARYQVDCDPMKKMQLQLAPR